MLSILRASTRSRRPVLRTKTNTFLGTQLKGRASCGASAAASSSSGSCCPCACGSTGGWAGSGPSSSRASASCGTSCATAAGGKAGERFCARRGVLSGRVCAALGRRSADPRWGGETRRPAAPFGVGRVRRSTAPLVRGTRKSQGFMRDDAAVRGSRWGPELHARGHRAAPQLCQSKELRPARAR